MLSQTVRTNVFRIGTVLLCAGSGLVEPDVGTQQDAAVLLKITEVRHLAVAELPNVRF